MTELDNIRKEARKATELDTPQDRAKAYRVVLSSAINYIFEQSKVKKPETASLLELIDSETVSAFIGDSDLINSLHYIRILGINAEHEQKIKKAEDKLAQSNLLYLIGLLEAQKSGTRAEYQKPPYMSEATTRKLYIDLYLREAGWDVLETENVCVAGKAGIEIQVNGMPNSQGIGFCDYVLYGRDGKPLAIVEAKKTSVSPEKGRHQVDLYGDCMKAVYGYKPILYYTNGYTTKIIDGLYPDRTVMAFHTIDELELMLQRRNRSDITDTKVDPRVAGRPYQSMAITNLCEWFNQKHRRGLLVMATGTGKTRVSIALVDVLTRNNWVKNVLFLADRTSLVHQAKVNFNKLLPNMSICELSSSDEKDYNARLMFCTYQTMINYIDAEDKRFTSGRFDLIIIDEAHRSIFNKYGSIFSYFDSLLVGLTATPKSEVDANTYRVFGCESGMPNFDYSLEEAVKDHYLVNYKSFNRTTKILSRGAKYNQLSDEDKLKVDQYLIEEPPTPDFTISEKSFFKIIYNKDTCKRIIEEFMTNGIKTNGGELIGKTIVFAYNHHHAEMIVECFHEMYPNYPANYCQLVDNYVKYADDLITRFEEDEEFRVAVSVDMLDTGIDVPAVVNLVFFKPVKSKIKFVQMIGRGTRLCPDLFGKGKDKTHFIIFDYCGNFEYFDQNPDGTDGSSALSLSQRFFEIRLDILYELQRIEYQSTEFGRSYYQKLKETLHSEICNIKKNSARLQVRAAMEWVDKYSDFDVWTCLSPVMVKEIKLHLVPLLDSGIKDKDLVIALAQSLKGDPDEQFLNYSGLDGWSVVSDTYEGTVNSSKTITGAGSISYYCSSTVSSNNLTYACSIVALSNLMKYYRSRGYTSISSNFKTLYNSLWNHAGTSSDGSTTNGKEPKAAKKYLSEVGYSCSYSSFKAYSKFVSNLDSNKPCLFTYGAKFGDHKGGHAVFVAGYVDTSSYQYLKIADGWNSYLRYINFNGYSYSRKNGWAFTISG